MASQSHHCNDNTLILNKFFVNCTISSHIKNAIVVLGHIIGCMRVVKTEAGKKRASTVLLYTKK